MTFEPGKNSPALHHYQSDVLFHKDTDIPSAFDEPALVAHFQDGPIKECGVNGTTNEEVIEMLISRIWSLQTMYDGKYACIENKIALSSLQSALDALTLRTLRRLDRGVEGTHVP